LIIVGLLEQRELKARLNAAPAVPVMADEAVNQPAIAK
jgi:hypothetical protein